MYDIKDHSYSKFRIGHVFVRIDSEQVCHPALYLACQYYSKACLIGVLFKYGQISYRKLMEIAICAL